jgi:hypothetical protein
MGYQNPPIPRSARAARRTAPQARTAVAASPSLGRAASGLPPHPSRVGPPAPLLTGSAPPCAAAPSASPTGNAPAWKGDRGRPTPRRGLHAGQGAQQLRSAYETDSPVDGRRIADTILTTLPTCPIPELRRRGETLKPLARSVRGPVRHRPRQQRCRSHRRTHRAHRRVARGFRNREHYRLRMLLIGRGLTRPPQAGTAGLYRPMLISVSAPRWRPSLLVTVESGRLGAPSVGPKAVRQNHACSAGTATFVYRRPT